MGPGTLIIPLCHHDLSNRYFQLKKFYKTVDTLKNNTSGFTWDDAKGLNVGPATESSFNTLVKVSGPTNIH